jgi:FPC/CPF motif-containing protein YcgG
LREAIIERDIELNGSANPMLARHGESSEALQYSGRRIEGAWRCPFEPRGSKT